MTSEDVPEERRLYPASIDEGTEGWEDFAAFIFGTENLELVFPPYQVGPYALGSQNVEVPYEELAVFLRPEYRSALGIDQLGGPSEA